MTPLPQWIEKVKRLREAATPGPWDWSDYGIYSTTQIDGPPGLQAPRQICSEVFLSDVEFIASAPETQELLEEAVEFALNALSLINNRCHQSVEGDRSIAAGAIAVIDKLGEK